MASNVSCSEQRISQRTCALARRRLSENRVLVAKLRRLARHSLDGDPLTPAEEAELESHSALVGSITSKLLRSRAARATVCSRRAEVPEPLADVMAKVARLADLLRGRRVILYTGAGVSTAANIPDYRGPNGAWTRLPRGAVPHFSLPGVATARPTFTHRLLAAMIAVPVLPQVPTEESVPSAASRSISSAPPAVPSGSASVTAAPSISTFLAAPSASSAAPSAPPCAAPSASSAALFVASLSTAPLGSASCTQIIRVVSQNCDGLHLRSGMPPELLSELHGNVFLEVCELCGRLVRRRFDVTERTGLRRHATGRICSGRIGDGGGCPGPLLDTVVHFGEFGRECTRDRVYEWRAAEVAAAGADLILCMGSSLQVLRHYPLLWPKGVPLVIVNLQATPFDRRALFTIRADCDTVSRALAAVLGVRVSEYDPTIDLLLVGSEPISEQERALVSKPYIVA